MVEVRHRLFCNVPLSYRPGCIVAIQCDFFRCIQFPVVSRCDLAEGWVLGVKDELWEREEAHFVIWTRFSPIVFDFYDVILLLNKQRFHCGSLERDGVDQVSPSVKFPHYMSDPDDRIDKFIVRILSFRVLEIKIDRVLDISHKWMFYLQIGVKVRNQFV